VETEVEKLTEDEMNQLKHLLVRYLAYHAQGLFNWGVEAVLAKYKSNTLIDVTPEQPRAPAAPAKRARQRKPS
jgi:hypothetical protein